MSIKPILFNQKMVSAILDGRKTVTRRLVKPHRNATIENVWFNKNDGEVVAVYDDCLHIGEKGYIKQKYQVGDILWVRETFAIGKISSGEESDGSERLYISQCDRENDIIPKEYATRNNIGVDDVIWKPSLFMPKEAARIFLEVTNVRIERLQDITEEQAQKEGAQLITTPNIQGKDRTYVQGFGEIWNSTVKEDWQKFESNPWVFVYEFERCEKPKGWCEKC